MFVPVVPGFIESVQQILGDAVDLSEFPFHFGVRTGFEALFKVVRCGPDVIVQELSRFATYAYPSDNILSCCPKETEL